MDLGTYGCSFCTHYIDSFSKSSFSDVVNKYGTVEPPTILLAHAVRDLQSLNSPATVKWSQLNLGTGSLNCKARATQETPRYRVWACTHKQRQ